MKTYSKILACISAISFVLLACGNDSSDNEAQKTSSTDMPVMDGRIVAYKKGMNEQLNELLIEPANWEVIEDKIFTANKNILKIIFPDIFDNEQPECSYFAFVFVGPSATQNYWILSQDMVLYQIWPYDAYPGGITEDVIADLMLVCDDTAEENLKEKIILNPTNMYIDPDWSSSESVYDRNELLHH